MNVGAQITAERVGTGDLADGDRRLLLERQNDEVTILHAVAKGPELTHPVGDTPLASVWIGRPHELLEGSARSDSREIGHFLPADDAKALLQSQRFALSVASGTHQPHGHRQPPPKDTPSVTDKAYRRSDVTHSP